MDSCDKEIALRDIMAQFDSSWENIVLNKEGLLEEEALKLKSSVLDVLNNISLHDYLSLLPASVLVTLGQHSIEKFTKHYIIELLRNIFSYRMEEGQIFLINYHEIAFNYTLENHVLAVYFSVMANERLPGFMSDTKQIQMNPYDLYYTRVSNEILLEDYAWGGLLYIPATMLNFTENEIKMWKLTGKQIEFTELKLTEMEFEIKKKITFKEKPKHKEERASVFGTSTDSC